jgi:hypothetical protein
VLGGARVLQLRCSQVVMRRHATCDILQVNFKTTRADTRTWAVVGTIGRAAAVASSSLRGAESPHWPALEASLRAKPVKMGREFWKGLPCHKSARTGRHRCAAP